MPGLFRERLNQQVVQLIENRGGWVFILIFLLGGLLVFCFVMVWIYFGPGLCSILIWNHQPSLYGLKFLCLSFSMLKMKVACGNTSQYDEHKTYFYKVKQPRHLHNNVEFTEHSYPIASFTEVWCKLNLRGVGWLVSHCLALDNNKWQSWALNMWFDFLNLSFFFGF